MFSNALIILVTLAITFTSILTYIISSIRAITISTIRPITMPSLSTLVTPFFSSSAVIITPLLTGSVIALGRVQGWPTFSTFSDLSDFIPFVLGLATYLFKVHPVLGFVFITLLFISAVTVLGLSEEADVSTWLVIPWLIAQACLWVYTSYGWYAWWAASIAIIIKNYGMSPSLWCIPQILACLFLKELFSYHIEEHIRQFGYVQFPDYVTYLFHELQNLEWSLDTRELFRWGDWSMTLVRRVAGQFTSRPLPPAGPVTPTLPVPLASPAPIALPAPLALPAPPARSPSPVLPQPAPLLDTDYTSLLYEPVDPDMLRGRRSHYRGIVRNESSANEWLKQRLSQPPCKEKWWEATDPVPPAPLFPRYIENPAPVKRFSLADWSGHNAFMAGIQNSASGFINGAPVFGVLTAPAPVPAPEPQLLSQPIYQQVLHQPEWVPEPQLPSQPIYQQVFHQPEWVPESQPPELASVVVYPANNVNFNTPCEPAVPALGQAIDIYNHNATPLYVTPQEPAPIVPTPMEVDIPEQVETLPEAMEDVQVDVQNTTGFMSVEQMEDDLVDHFEALANAQASVSDNTNAGQADNAQDDQPGYESLDDRMGASPFNDCKIREKQTPTKSQSQPMHKPKSDKPHALSSSVQSSSTTPSKSLGGGLQASMYNANNLASAAQTPSSQALSSTLQSKPPVKQSPLTKALAQLSNPQMPLPQAQQTIAQSSPAPPMSQFSVPQVQLPQVPATTPKPKQTVQQMPLPQALPQTLQPQPTTSQMAWPQPAPPVSEPQQTMVLPPLKPQQTTQQKPSTQALPQKPKPQPTTSQLTGSETTSSTPKPKQTTSQEPSSQALPQMPQVQKAMASTRRIATPKSRKAMINQAEKPSSTTAAQAPAPKPKAAARLPGKSKPANATSVLYTEPGPSVPKKDKGKGRATQPPVLVDEEDDFEDKVCEFMDGGLSNEQAYIMAEHYFNQRRISRR